MLSKEQLSTVRNASKRSLNVIDELLMKEKIPVNGWSDGLLTQFMEALSSADSNNREDGIGAGEREGRVASDLVRRLHFGMTHGIGRSGNIAECQPKALGSSALNSIANNFALEALQLLGLNHCKKAILLPVCTGMALTLSLLTLKQMKPTATRVVWHRIDQKSCFKSIIAAGLVPMIVQPKVVQENDRFELILDEEHLEDSVKFCSDEDILCVLTTTSCFAPRCPDNLESASKFAAKHGCFHLVNNAYGLQSAFIAAELERCLKSGKVDLFVQSTDKNFLTPVGGSIVASSNKELVKSLGKLYPGRASAVPSRDFVLTMLHFVKNGLLKIMEERKAVNECLLRKMMILAKEFGENTWQSTGNEISIAMSLKNLSSAEQKHFGGILYSKYKVTGARVVSSTTDVSTIAGYEFINFGSHTNFQHDGYLTVASGVGMTFDEIDKLIDRLSEILTEMRNISKKSGV
uniref:O-phosphoseryl-tRNA(Sec) selenium transferase n=1 Tax=Panagrolaimus sp. JU765 TaxID=591449 RepID=A0AC34QPS5_9BILA